MQLGLVGPIQLNGDWLTTVDARSCTLLRLGSRIAPLLGHSSKRQPAKMLIGRGRAGQLDSVDDLVHAFLFFAAPVAGVTTGQTLYVSGGESVGAITLRSTRRSRC